MVPRIKIKNDMTLSTTQFPIIKSFESEINVFHKKESLSFEDVEISKIEYNGEVFKFVKPRVVGRFAFGGNYLDISSSPALVELIGANKVKIHDRDMSKEV